MAISIAIKDISKEAENEKQNLDDDEDILHTLFSKNSHEQANEKGKEYYVIKISKQEGNDRRKQVRDLKNCWIVWQMHVVRQKKQGEKVG